MTGSVSLTMEDNLAFIEISNPPVNALSQTIRESLVNAITEAQKDTDVEAIILYGQGKHFIAGADIREFNLPPKEPSLPDTIQIIEECTKPVIAALAGSVLGGGLEVALGAHFRVALKDAKLGLPEVTLGLIPGAGGTQRLPRLIGIEKSIEIATFGKPVSASESLEIGLIDDLSDETDALQAGKAFAHIILNNQAPIKRLSSLTCEALKPKIASNWQQTLKKKFRGQIAPLKCLEALNMAASHSFADGMKEERAIFMSLRESDQRVALTHVFFAERAAAKLPDLANIKSGSVSQIGIVGGGTMGAGIAVSCLLAGYNTCMVERDEEAAQKGKQTVFQMLASAVKRGRISAKRYDEIEASFIATTEYSIFKNADLVIEAVFEDFDAKKAVFQQLESYCPDHCILASNTSYLDLNEIAQTTTRPQNVIGLHFFSPAHIMKLLEIVIPDQVDAKIIANCFDFAKRLGKIAVRSGVCDGFIGNRLMMRYRLAADAAVIAGASPYEVDQAIVKFGFAMGPYAVSDLAGIDIAWASRKRRAAIRDPRELVTNYMEKLCEMGRFGRKTKRGYYLYDELNPNGVEDPEVLELINQERNERGISPRHISTDEIAKRYLLAMINEACKILEEGIAHRPLDIDLTLIHGYGFPRWKGGPMHYADQLGLAKILHDIKALQNEDNWFWEPASLLEKLVAEGKTFSDLNS
ncbi:3-hydroxyacyl-CoA dehydrogenase NAD-binding domain-containing protein [Curvivirga aplysinae]|uniref:3-hydroxyacyl-CoA dehydrogenase NAD-binding domain-containing protein n=1 Tax=Curvivirga aplysinae TaxID=2529852 RepID=UPI0012BCBDCA|nr:3-hydroxyacyl-CoA dehydrogenase NAD-binding domain-containing protein [Curvivirga aplysinae]MTI11039.1 3-hydroxyacyl-CoA dehydrogenase [Curvivirga aplysinae]